MADTENTSTGMRIAIEGCGHGTLHDIYAEVGKKCKERKWDGVDLLIIGGDFQAVRNTLDLHCMNVPLKFRAIGDFQEYYSGARVAPYLSIFVGGNHEASNHNFELSYGGWAAPNIYFMGAANVLQLGPLRIAGMSGIFKGHDYRKPHFERLPYNQSEITTIYHTREVDTRKLRQLRTQVDIGVSHDWPRAIEWLDREQLFRHKAYFKPDSDSGRLGSAAARDVLDHLRPVHWFSAHLHTRFKVMLEHDDELKEKSVLMGRQDQASVANDVSSKMQNDTHHDTEKVSDTPTQAHLASDVQNDEEIDLGLVNDGTSAATSNAAAVYARNDQEIDLGLDDDDDEAAPPAAGQAATSSSALTEQKVTPQSNAIPNSEQSDFDHRPSKRMRIAGSFESQDQQQAPDTISMRNQDELHLDLDDSNADARPAPAATTDATSSRLTAMDLKENGVAHNAAPLIDTPSAADVADKPKDTSQNSNINEEARALLPASFQKRKPSPPSTVLPDPPTSIQNNTTNFLALSKCGAGRKFLDVMEIPLDQIASPQAGPAPQRPFHLSYDPEWLAITRAFAAPDNNLMLIGDPSASIPRDKGRAHYLPLIEREEAWVQEHIVAAGKLAVPSNFEITAPIYDPAATHELSEMPPEYSNPQTEAYCELLQIANPFKLSEQERDARIERGPRAMSPSSKAFFERKRGGGGGGRGGGRGRGNRGGRGGRGGFGRGRPLQRGRGRARG